MSTEALTLHSPPTTHHCFQGNRTTSHLSTTHLHDSANRLLEDDSFTYAYDANGNRILRTRKRDNAQTRYTYDIENQLIQVQQPATSDQDKPQPIDTML